MGKKNVLPQGRDIAGKTDDRLSTGDAPTHQLPWFEWTNELKFNWYMQRRSGYSAGARDSYQRYDQTIAGVSAGAIVLSITFLKDVGYAAPSIPFLYLSWLAFLVAGGASLTSLRTSADTDIERLHQLETLCATGRSDETRARRLGRWTVRLNHLSLFAVILGILFMMSFAAVNYRVLDSSARRASINAPQSSAASAAKPVQKVTKKP